VTGGEAERGVLKLLPTVVNTHHRMYRVTCDCGTYLGRTYISHGSPGKDIGTNANKMAKQLHITLTLFRELADCKASRPEYLAARGHIHSSP
jgi:hypothetical protein